MINVDAELKEFAAIKTKRSPYENIWELIAKFIFQRKQGFVSVSNPGQFYTAEDVYHNIAGDCLQKMVSSIDGALWKNGGRTFRVMCPRQIKSQSTEVKDFYKEVNARICEQMEHEKAAFGTARQEALAECAGFGTDGLGTFRAPKGSDHKLEYRAMSLKKLFVVEDARGRVIKEYYEDELDAFQIFTEYGDVALTDKVKALIEKEDHETKMKVLWIVRPRANINPESLGKERYSYESIHILVPDKMVIREEGYDGNPIAVTRFFKNENEEYGRCPGYEALVSTVVLSGVVEILTKGGELSYNAPWWVLDDGTFGNGVIDRSPGAIIPIDATSSRISGMAPMGQIGTVGDMNPLIKLFEFLVEEIKGHFLNDQLMDLNNRTRMTLGEAQIRNELRADSTGAIFSRQIDEKLIPTIRRTIAILKDDGTLGVISGTAQELMVKADGQDPLYIPDDLVKLIQQGVDIFPIRFISPAARILRSEELRGLVSTWQFAAGFGQVAPELILRLDKKKSLVMVNELYGAPDDILLSDEEFEKELKAYNEAQQARMQLEAATVQADVKTKEASANQQNAQAQATMGGMNGMINNVGGGGVNPAMIL